MSFRILVDSRAPAFEGCSGFPSDIENCAHQHLQSHHAVGRAWGSPLQTTLQRGLISVTLLVHDPLVPVEGIARLSLAGSSFIT